MYLFILSRNVILTQCTFNFNVLNYTWSTSNYINKLFINMAQWETICGYIYIGMPVMISVNNSLTEYFLQVGINLKRRVVFLNHETLYHWNYKKNQNRNTQDYAIKSLSLITQNYVLFDKDVSMYLLIYILDCNWQYNFVWKGYAWNSQLPSESAYFRIQQSQHWIQFAIF